MRSLGCSEDAARTIVELRNREPFKDTANLKTYLPATLSVDAQNLTSTIFKVYSYATVGGYTRQIEAVIVRGSTTPRYWRVM
jgi:hypothetical protein